jgi:hypothetical protein
MMTSTLPSRRALLTAALALVPFGAAAQSSILDQGKSFLKQQAPGATPGQPAASSGSGLSLGQGEIGSGLKDALKIASQRVIGRVGTADGYNGDSAIRIPLPDVLAKIKGPLAAVGGGPLLDDLQVKMNRAAEQAAPKALDIFAAAASQMTINDARSILSGPSDAATQYFKRTTSASLTTSFRPIVDTALSGTGAAGVLKAVQAKAGGIPMVGQQAQALNLTDFTVGKALDGLFHYLGVEEAAIRANPAARTTDLLKKVFG